MSPLVRKKVIKKLKIISLCIIKFSLPRIIFLLDVGRNKIISDIKTPEAIINSPSLNPKK